MDGLPIWLAFATREQEIPAPVTLDPRFPLARELHWASIRNDNLTAEDFTI